MANAVSSGISIITIITSPRPWPPSYNLEVMIWRRELENDALDCEFGLYFWGLV